MKISAFIRSHADALALEWQEYARTLLPAAAAMSDEELRDSAAELLRAVASDMDSPQSSTDQQAKSRGRRPGNSPRISAYARRHAATRLDQGFTLDQVASEYRALRASVLRQWLEGTRPASPDVQDLMRFNEAIDEALTESLAWYGDRIAHARELFLGALGHDLRTPLGAILVSAELLFRDESLGTSSTKAAVRIFNSANRMRNMITDLLDFTRTRLGVRLPIEKSWSSLGPLFRQTVEELLSLHPDRRIDYDAQGDLSGHWDVSRLQQMLSNLAGNAIQHGEAGTPVTVLARGEEAAVIVTVHNEGPPIAAAMLDKIFDPLMRGVVKEAERRNHQTSLGLGLYICREIAQAHGGDISVSSSREGGTTFTVKLPRTSKARPGA